MKFLCVLCFALAACPPYACANSYWATVLAPPPRGYNDGDTLHMRLAKCVPLPSGERICGRVRVRIAGINAPELRAKAACERKLARIAADELLTLTPIRSRVRLSNPRREKYGRLMADMQTKNQVDVAGELLKRGLVKTYHGEKRRPWCED